MYGDNVFYLSTRPIESAQNGTQRDGPHTPNSSFFLTLFFPHNNYSYVPTNPEQNGLITMIYIPTYTELKSKPFSQATAAVDG